MTVKQAREAARRWMLEEGSLIPGFCGAYTAGSTNWLPDHAHLPATSDVDIMVVLADAKQSGKRGKLIYAGTLLEISYLGINQFQSADQILADYHLAPSFHTAPVLLDRSGHLTRLAALVSRDYHKKPWVRQRCLDARQKVIRTLQSIDPASAKCDQAIACLFAAGVTTHALLVAGVENPTVRGRYVAVRELLTRYGHFQFHEKLLQLLGAARISRERVLRHLDTLAEIYDAAKPSIRTPLPFAADISGISRLIAIDGSLELISRGYHREAMFWIGVTHSRCQKVLACDAPHWSKTFEPSYENLLADLGLATFGDIQTRRAEIERALPEVCDLAERITASNREIEADQRP